MFAGWGTWVARFRWPVLIVALVAVIGAGVWGLGVFGQLTEGGYNDPNSESTHAGQVVTDTFGTQGGDLVVIYTPAKGKIDDPQLAKRVKESLGKLPRSAVSSATSYWSARSAQYAAKDKSSAVAVITLAGDDDAAKLDSYRAIDDKFAVEGAKVQLSGGTAIADASSARSTRDLGRAEAISLPITLILLVLIFGSLVAASLPVLVGGAAVLGSLGILHAVSAGTDVNSFAVNVASLLGLGMAIDYGLFLVGRFREELAAGRTTSEAVSRTVGTAGRTVVFSATLLMIALAGLLLFPQSFLNSLAYGGLAAVFLAALLSLTLLPALLAVLGPRVDKLPVRLPRRTGRGEPGSGWARLAGVVLRHPVVVAAPILLILVLFASPIRSVHFGENDERILPAGDPARRATETLKADYPQFTGDNVQVVLRGNADSAGFAVRLRQIPGVAQIGAARKDKGVTLFTATLKTKDAYGTEARDVVDAIRALPVPGGAQLLVGGTTARNVDSVDATANKLPWMVAMLVGATLLLMFLAFGSVLLPVKAVLMSALSLSATFGLLVWIFQQGHGASLLDVTPAPLEVGIVVLMAAVVFGLSTDYEVFLLSRMVEARIRGASTDEAVTTGLARTGRVISAAALLLIVVTGAFALSAVTSMRFVGVGMIIALLLDATVVRLLLVPAVLRLLGDAAWWAPGPLRRLQQRAGLSEYEEEPAPAGRHAALDDTQVIRYAPYGAELPAGVRAAHALPAGSPSPSLSPSPSPSPSLSLSPSHSPSHSPLHSPDERHALPSGEPALALPVGSLSADDATQVFARFEETAVINLAGLPPLEEVEAETVDDAPVPSPSADDDSIVDAEILEDEPDIPAYVEAASAQPWELPAPYEPHSPGADWTVPDDDGFYFGTRAEPSSYDTSWIPSPSEAPAEVADLFAGAHDSNADAPVDAVTAESLTDPFAAESLTAESLTGPLAAEPEDVAWSSATAEDLAWSPAAAEPDDLPAPEDVTSPWAVAEPEVAEPEFVASPQIVIETASPWAAAEDEVAEPEFADEPPVPVDLWETADRRPTSLADQLPARRSPNTLGRAADLGAYTPEGDPGLMERPTPETGDHDGQTSTRRPATLGDQPFPRRPIPSSPEPQPMTEPEPQPLAAAAPAASEPADPPPLAFEPADPPPLAFEPADPPTPEPAAHEPADPPAHEPTPFVPPAVPEVPAAYVVHEPPPLRAIPDVVAPRATPTPPPPPQIPPQPDPMWPESMPSEPTQPGSTQPEWVPSESTQPSSTQPEWMPAESPQPEPTLPEPMPAAAGPGPIPEPPQPAVAAPSPHVVPPAAAVGGRPVAARRPADLADHLRESRPADLSDYTAGRVPRMRRPAEDKQPKAPRRPATLADHLSSRKPADESTHDLRDHATRE